MTTTVEKRIFGITVETDYVSGDVVNHQINPLTDSRIRVEDSPHSGVTIVTEETADLQELLERVFSDKQSPSWDVRSINKLTKGESIVIGPVWCRLKITRET